MSVIVKKGKFEEEIEHLPLEYPFELDDFQLHATKSILDGFNILNIAHTGCGKTVVAEMAIAHHDNNHNKIIYASPIKSLSNQKYSSFSKKFDSVGLITGDIQIAQDANILIMTTEILLNSIDKSTKEDTIEKYKLEEDFTSKISCVIFDEIHYLNDPDRGKTWVRCINLLNRNIQLIMLSATISEPEEFAQWISNIKEKDTIIVSTEKRIVPLHHYVLIDNKQYQIMDEKDNFNSETYDIVLNEFEKMKKEFYKKHKGVRFYINNHIINESIEYFKRKDMLNTIFFCFSIRNCKKFAEIVNPLLTSKESADAVNMFDKLLNKHKKKYERCSQYHHLRDMISKGVAYHHAGLIEVLKNAVEYLFDMSLVKVLFATETFAAGVDMPTRTVVFTGLIKPTSSGKRPLMVHEYKQMAGRAGRRGKDIKGNVVVIPVYELISKQELKNTMTGTVPKLVSQLKFDYSFLLKLGLNHTTDDIQRFIDDSLYKMQDNKYKIKRKEQIEKELSDLTEPIIPDEYYNDIIKLYKKYQNEQAQLKMGLTIKKSNKYKNYKEDLIKLNKKYDGFKMNFNFYLNYNIRKNELNNELESLMKSDEEDLLNFQLQILRDNQFITMDEINYKKLSKENYTLKGFIASKINDCNPIVLTELIFNYGFRDLTSKEIVGLMSIFIDEIRTIEPIMKENRRHRVIGTENMHLSIDMVEEIIEFYAGIEESNNIFREKYWKINYDFIDISYNWVDGKSFGEINDKNINEGNFIKAMIRLNNLIKEIYKLAILFNDLELAKKIEPIEEMIMRNGKDIVSVESLYLEN